MSLSYQFDLDKVDAFSYSRLIDFQYRIERPDRHYGPGLLTDEQKVVFEFYTGLEKVLSSFMRKDDFYQMGYQPETTQIIWEIQGSYGNRPPSLEGSTPLTFQYEYPDFSLTPFSFSILKEEILYLREERNPNNNPVRVSVALAMIAFTLSEAPRFPMISRRFTTLAASVKDPNIFVMLSDYQELVKLWFKLSRLAEKAENQNIRDPDSEPELSVTQLQELLEGAQDDPIKQRKARFSIGILCLPNPAKEEKTKAKEEKKKAREKDKAKGGSDNSLKSVLKADYEFGEKKIQFGEDVRIVFGALSDGGYYVKKILYNRNKFSKGQARKWGEDNMNQIMNAYNVKRRPQWTSIHQQSRSEYEGDVTFSNYWELYEHVPKGDSSSMGARRGTIHNASAGRSGEGRMRMQTRWPRRNP